MSATTGEEAREDAEFRCERCRHPVHLSKGERMPRCPNCGHDRFETRQDEISRLHRNECG
jgi:DNA-directed RNA polymerase subunit RPC12/RpoP